MKLMTLGMTLLVLSGCQAAGTNSAVNSQAASGAGGACGANSIAVDASGKASLNAQAGTAPAGGTCYPVQALTTNNLEAKTASGKYRLTLETPTGKVDSAEPKGALLVRVYDASGKEVTTPQVRLQLTHAVHGSGHGLDPNGMTTTAQASGGYKLEPLAFPMAGPWLVTARVMEGSAEERASWAIDVK